MPNDEQYGRELSVRMRHETEDIQAAPDLARRVRRRQAQHRWAITVAAAVPLAVAVAAGVLVAAQANDATNQAKGPTAEPNGTTPIAIDIVDVAYVQKQTVAALGTAEEYLIYSKTTYDTGYYETWTDKSTQQYRNDVYTTLLPLTDDVENLPDGSGRDAPGDRRDGEPAPRLVVPAEVPTGPMRLDQSHSVTGPPGGKVETTVDYDGRWWSQSPTEWPVNQPSEVPDMTDPDDMREAINAGTVELLGQEQVNGINTLHLRIAVTQRGYRVDLWVDSSSYLPVQETESTDDRAAVTRTFAWLPRTEENLARLVLTPPPGFVRL